MNHPIIQNNELSCLVSFYMAIDQSSKENALWKALRICYEIRPADIASKYYFNLSSIYNIEKGTKASTITWTSFKTKMLDIYSLTKEEYLSLYDSINHKNNFTEDDIICVSRILKINTFSCLVIYRRNTASISQFEIATSLKVSRQYYQMIESGKRLWNPDYIYLVCKLLNIDFLKSKIVSENLIKLNFKHRK